MKKIFLPLLFLSSLVSCNASTSVIEERAFYFDTYIDVKMYEGNKEEAKEIIDIFKTYSLFSDNYKATSELSKINSSNDELSLSKALYDLLKTAFSYDKAVNFNPLCGSLSKAWKESLEKGEVLSEEVINNELTKMNNSSLSFLDNDKVKRNGEASIDLGAIAKGYTLDKVYDYLSSKSYKHYLINAGNSSILLGEKKADEGFYKVGIDTKILDNSYIKMKNCFISTSSIYQQGVTIDGVTYSHIVNPHNGSAININDAVIVISDTGYIGDILSTSLMNNTIDEIKELEKELNIKCIVTKDKKVTYCNENIEVLHN